MSRIGFSGYSAKQSCDNFLDKLMKETKNGHSMVIVRVYVIFVPRLRSIVLINA